jgi:hypothetical protein
MMLVPYIVGGSPVISCIMTHNRHVSSRRCSLGTAARNPSTDASVRRIAGSLLVAMPLLLTQLFGSDGTAHQPQDRRAINVPLPGVDYGISRLLTNNCLAIQSPDNCPVCPFLGVAAEASRGSGRGGDLAGIVDTGGSSVASSVS